MTDMRDAAPPAPPAFRNGHTPGLAAALSPVSLPPQQRRVDGRTGPGSVPIKDADAADLRRKLSTLPVIEQAKGMLMVLHGCDADTAYEMLRRWSRDHNLKLRALCTDMVAAAVQPDSEPLRPLRDFLRTNHLS